MKKALVLLLVVVVVVTGLPVVAMGMSAMARCHDCGPARVVDTACTLAILAGGVALFFGLLARRLRTRRRDILLLLHSFVLERPPQLA